jgi:hypothetical protein
MPRVALPIQLDMDTHRMLDKFAHSSSTPQSLALRSRIILAAAKGSANQQIASALKIPPVTVGKWRQSFAIHGMEGLRDAPRSGRPPKYDADTRHNRTASGRLPLAPTLTLKRSYWTSLGCISIRQRMRWSCAWTKNPASRHLIGPNRCYR